MAALAAIGEYGSSDEESIVEEKDKQIEVEMENDKIEERSRSGRIPQTNWNDRFPVGRLPLADPELNARYPPSPNCNGIGRDLIGGPVSQGKSKRPLVDDGKDKRATKSKNLSKKRRKDTAKLNIFIPPQLIKGPNIITEDQSFTKRTGKMAKTKEKET